MEPKKQLETALLEISKREHLMVVYRDQIRRQAASINRLRRANKRLRELVKQYVPKPVVAREPELVSA